MCQKPVYVYGFVCLSWRLSSSEPCVKGQVSLLRHLNRPVPFCLCLCVKLNFKEGKRSMPWPLVIDKALYAFLFASKCTVFGSGPNPYISLSLPHGFVQRWHEVAVMGADSFLLLGFRSLCANPERSRGQWEFYFRHVFTVPRNTPNQPPLHAISCL